MICFFLQISPETKSGKNAGNSCFNISHHLTIRR